MLQKNKFYIKKKHAEKLLYIYLMGFIEKLLYSLWNKSGTDLFNSY